MIEKSTPKLSGVRRLNAKCLVTAAILFVAAAQAYAVSGIDLYNKGKYEEA